MFKAMKKLHLLTICLMGTSAFSQKADKGNFTTEIGVNLSSNSSINSTINSFGLNGRYFFKSNIAMVGGLSGSYNKTDKAFYELPDGSGKKGSDKRITKNVEISLGIQKHLKGTKRLSPFIGGEVFSNFGSNKISRINTNGSTYDESFTYDIASKNQTFGVRAVVGFDYWIAQGLYIGAIFKPISISYKEEKDDVITITDFGVTTNRVSPGSKVLQMNTFERMANIRFGWVF